MYARYDLRRWMSYNHTRNGNPESDGIFFNRWSQPGDRGGLNSPQAVGILPLHIDYDHLMVKSESNYPNSQTYDAYVWDENNKTKQPYTNRYENANVDFSKIQSWTDVNARKNSPFNGSSDSIAFVTKFANAAEWAYWKGRGKPSITTGWTQPVTHGYVFGPYKMPKGEHLRFTIAEVVGYGPGVASDSIFSDIGGVNNGAGNNLSNHFNPVPSWYNVLTYANVGGSTPQPTGVIGSNYLQTHELPWYVTPGVVSIRDVADRAIQLYTGNALVKWDTLQFEPDKTPAIGAYNIFNTSAVPIPGPVVTVENTGAAINRLVWGPQVESFPYNNFSHYLAYRASSALGPWVLIDSIGKRDIRYWRDSSSFHLLGSNYMRDSAYILYDKESNVGEDAYYIVYSVDSFGQRGGVTNFTMHSTQAPAALTLDKVWVTPNPLIVTNGKQGSSVNGEITDQIGFFGLTKKCTIRIYSYSGQLIQTIDHDTPPTAGYSQEWFQITRNNQLLASGVYFFVVEDAATGKRVTGKFVIIH